MIKIFGIPSCDTVKKARIFLEKNQISYDFVDFKKTAPSKTDMGRWRKVFGGLPVNTKGQTYKKLKNEYEALSATAQVDFLVENTSMIKRPILEQDGEVLAFGFDEDLYSEKLSL
jgi:Spx/MgsR family transcriptional regulator